LWAVFTLIAAAAQTVRNAAQRELTAKLGTVGATHVRFLFGCPFALAFLAAIVAAGAALPRPGPVFWPWLLDGALAQIAATALMLAAMGQRSFVVAIAYIKTEPVQVALFGLIFLGDTVTPGMAAAILIATAGVVVMSVGEGAPRTKDGPRATEERPHRASDEEPIAEKERERTGGGPTGKPAPFFVRAPSRGFRSLSSVLSQPSSALLGLSAGACFALSAIGYRGAILSLRDPDYVVAATFTLAAGLVLQVVLLTVYLGLRQRAVLTAIMRAWRPSLFAGFMGALASQFWFLAFALATAASVRTLALVEVLFAQAISRFVFKQPAAPRETIGIAAIIIGVALLIWAY
jgi:drug/metabolite transporter (DMT)-like permease